MAWTDLVAYTAQRWTVTLAEQLRGNFKAIGDPWTSYGTPSTLWTAVTTNPTIGNGTCTARFMQAGKLVHGSLSIVMGSTTTFGSGQYIFLLPSAAHDFRCLDGTAALFDASAVTVIPRLPLGLNSTSFAVADMVPNRVSNSSPVAWATGDRIDIGFSYESA